MSIHLTIGKILGKLNVLDIIQFIEVPIISKTNYYYTYGYNNEIEYIVFKESEYNTYVVLNKDIESIEIEELLIRHLEYFLNEKNANDIQSIINRIPQTSQELPIKPTTQKKAVNLLIKATKLLNEPLSIFETEYSELACLTNKNNKFSNVIFAKQNYNLRYQLFNNSNNYVLKQIRDNDKKQLALFDIMDIDDPIKFQETLHRNENITHTLIISQFNFDILELINKLKCTELHLYYTSKTKAIIQLIKIHLFNIRSSFTFDYDAKNEDIQINIIGDNTSENKVLFRKTITAIDTLFQEKYYDINNENNVFYNLYSQYLHRSSLKQIGNKQFLIIKTTQKDHFIEIIHNAIEKTLNTIKINYNEYL